MASGARLRPSQRRGSSRSTARPESDEELLLRSFAAFSCVDGVVCGEDAVFLHAPASSYEPAPSAAHGDTRPAPMLDLLTKQRPFVARLLRDYELRGWLGAGQREQLEAGLLAPRRSGYHVAVDSATSRRPTPG